MSNYNSFSAPPIGENIRQLRKKKEVTQETLAAYLNISCQAISKWERGESVPELSLIFPLAEFFGVSTDELLGYSEGRREKAIQDYLHRYAVCEVLYDLIGKQRVLKEAYAVFPEDFRILNLCLSYLISDPDVEDAYQAHREELTRLCRKILGECTIDAIRYRAMDIMARLLYNAGDEKQAVELLSNFPSAFQTANQRIVALYGKTAPEHLSYGRKNLAELLEATLLQLRQLTQDDRSFTPEDQLEQLKRGVEMTELFFPDGDFGLFHYHLSDIHFRIANRYMMLGKTDEVLPHLEKAFDHAVAFDSMTEKFVYTSPLLRDLDFWRGSRSNIGYEHKLEAQLEYLNDTCGDLYDPMYVNPKFRALVDKYSNMEIPYEA